MIIKFTLLLTAARKLALFFPFYYIYPVISVTDESHQIDLSCLKARDNVYIEFSRAAKSYRKGRQHFVTFSHLSS